MERVNQETGMDPTAVMRRDTITEIVSYRNAAVAEWERFFAALDSAHRHCREARKLAALACGGDQTVHPLRGARPRTERVPSRHRASRHGDAGGGGAAPDRHQRLVVDRATHPA